MTPAFFRDYAEPRGAGTTRRLWPQLLLLTFILLFIFSAASVFAHGVAEGDKAFFRQNQGMQLIPYLYLGAKHMVTGYDHLLFLFGVVFFLYRLRDVGLYVSLFAIGHSTTLLLGVWNAWHINPYLVDTIIGLSVVYRAFDNLGGFSKIFGIQPNKKAAVLIFGFFHGLGLATKLQDFALSKDGLIPNMLAFNVGVEVGQLLALGMILVVMRYWRSTSRFVSSAFQANVLLMASGFLLAGYQFAGYLLNK